MHAVPVQRSRKEGDRFRPCSSDPDSNTHAEESPRTVTGERGSSRGNDGAGQYRMRYVLMEVLT
jgi:hypothetical protein